MRHLRLILVATFALVGCATPALHRADASYAAGRWAEADRELREAAQDPEQRAAAQQRLESLREQRLGAAKMLGEQAAKARASADAQGGDDQAALELLREAVSLLFPGEPGYDDLRAQLTALEAQQAQRDQAFEQALAALERDSGACDAGWLQSFATVRQLRKQAGSQRSLTPVARDAAEACDKKGDHAGYIARVDLARGALLPGEALPPALLLRASYLASKEPPPAPVAEAEPELPPVEKPHKLAKKPPAHLEAPAPPPAPEADTATPIIEKCQALRAEGKLYEALIALDDAIAHASGPAHARLAELSQTWRADRQALVARYLREAEDYLARQMADPAYDLYARVLKLQPGHPVAEDRLRRLQRLRELRAHGT